MDEILAAMIYHHEERNGPSWYDTFPFVREIYRNKAKMMFRENADTSPVYRNDIMAMFGFGGE